MSGVLKAIEAMVRERVGARWPELREISIGVRPLLDLALGDFGIDCCLAIGANLKLRPEVVAEEIVSALPAGEGYRFAATDGFINVTLTDPLPLLRESREGGVSTPQRILVQAITPEVELDGYARLVSAALVQQTLAHKIGSTCEVIVGGERAPEVRSMTTHSDWLSRLATQTRGEARRELEQQLCTPFGGISTVWIAPTFLGKGDFRDFYRDFFTENPACTLRCPARGWVEGFQESWWEIFRSGKHLESSVVMLASSRLPTELDPYALSRAEQGNLRWFLRATHERLKRFENVAALQGEGAELSPEARRVAIRSATVRFFELEGARGDVQGWSDAVTDLLRGINVWINRPDRRRALESGQISHRERQILSGATEAVSDIMQSNPLF